MTISVIVPTYRRPHDLERCLESLKKQTRPADEVLVVIRDIDTETWSFFEIFDLNNLRLHAVTVKLPGVVAAMNVGIELASGDFIAFIDDDAAPHSDWLQRIEAHFLSDPYVGGVGGRDWVYRGTQLEDGAHGVVGKLQWFGRVIGNHHIGIGQPRKVDVLKGVNMCFRRTAIAGLRFDKRMRGTGAQVHFELAFCLALRRAGWQLTYDPMAGVDHHRGERFDEDQRDRFNSLAVTNSVHNETLALLEHLPPTRHFLFFLWAILVGNRDARGFFQWLRFFPSEGRLAGQKLLASLCGRWQGWQTWKQSVK
jgi:cellulose synthase/poly-beta-1,6-N-acetylglucosamine synthase-like glycosyltransferase